MDERVREYTKMLLDRASSGRPAGREGARPWVLPIVVYNGSEPWTAAGRGNGPGGAAFVCGDAGVGIPSAAVVPFADGRRGLDCRGARPAQDWPLNNRVSATVRLQAAATPQDLLPRLLEEFARFPGAENEAFRRALHSWARALWEDKTVRASGFPAL